MAGKRVQKERVTERSIAIGKLINAAIPSGKPYGISSSEKLSAAIGHDRPGRLRHIIRGRTEIEDEEVDKIRNALHLEAEWPETSLALHLARKGEFISYAGIKLGKVTLIGDTPGGNWSWNVDILNGLAKVPQSMAMAGNLAYVAPDDSNMPFVEQFDTMVFKADDAKSKGLYHLIQMGPNTYKVGRLDFGDGGWRIVPLNEQHSPEQLPDLAKVLGFLIGIYRIKGSRESIFIDPDGLVPE